MSISIVLVLVQKCIVYQQIVRICCEILTLYCCTKYSLSIKLREHASSHCVVHKGLFFQQKYHKWCRIIKLYLFTKFCACTYSCYCVTEACMSMYGPKLFLWFSKNGDVYTNFTMPIFCVLPNSITSSSFECWSISVSEIREFNRKKKKKNNSKQYRPLMMILQ